MYCVNCGNKLENNYNFCPKCGTKIVEVKEEKVVSNEYDEIKKFIIDNGSASIALLQRTFKLSYKKASEYINKLESEGVIGPSNGSKPREVLIKKEVKEEKIEDKVKNKIEDIMDTPDKTDEFDKDDAKDNLFLALLSYLGPFALIPYFIDTNSKYVKYHAVQGMNLLIVLILYTIVNNLLSLIKVRDVVIDFGTGRAVRMVTPFWISIPMSIVGILIGIISIIGIVYVCEGKAKELPIINKIKIIK